MPAPTPTPTLAVPNQFKSDIAAIEAGSPGGTVDGLVSQGEIQGAIDKGFFIGKEKDFWQNVANNANTLAGSNGYISADDLAQAGLTAPPSPTQQNASVPTPLGIIKGGDHDGYLSYRPAGADPTDDSQIQYARPLGQDITGPNGEPMFEFPEGKQGYETKDPQDPTHSRTIIQLTDPASAAMNQTTGNQALTDSVMTTLNQSATREGDIATIVNNHLSQLKAIVTSNSDQIIGRQDWENFASPQDNPQLDAVVQDPLERARIRAVAQTVVGRIHNADKMSLKDALGAFGDDKNQLIDGAQGATTYDKLESIADGSAPLTSVSADQREYIRQAAARIIYVPLTTEERALSAGGSHHIDDNKYGKAQGGATIFTYLDNAFSSRDNNGNFNTDNVDDIKVD